MGAVRTGGFIAGAAGNLLVGYAIYSLLSRVGAAGCANGVACDVDVGSAVLALPVGIILSIAGIFMAGFLFFSGLFLAIGVGSLGAAALGHMPGMETFGWIFGGMFAVGGLAPLIGGRVMGGVAARRQATALELIRTGVKGVGTITDVRDTGITINDNPRVRITMRIAPIDGSPEVERQKTATVSRVAVPRVGERFPAWFDRTDPDRWAFGTDMEESAAPEIKDMFARTRGAAAGAPEKDDALGEIERLSALWTSGALTDREFADAKARLLSQVGR